ncbi:MAG TPA: DUF1453 domain-containing protein [Verrucomicrobiae bacterium]|nr:DUF1453 domain-containing protein [Verrucomicrobiae bacterium]
MAAAPVIPILFGGLMAWSIYRRVRRNIGRQKLHPRRTVTSIVILSIFSLLIVAALLQNEKLLLGFGGGLLPGAVLGFVGLRLTRFETTDEGHFYKPNAHIGVALSLLLIGRMVYRVWVLNNASIALNHPPAMQSPLTFFIIGLTFGYYLVYQTGLFIHSRSIN